MMLKEKLGKELRGNLIMTSTINNSLLKQFLKTIEEDSLNPMQFYLDWFHGDESILNRISHSLVTDYSLELRNGNRTKDFFISSFLSFSLTNYIKKQFHLSIDFKANQLLVYDYKIYQHLTFVTLSMLINKYNPETLYKEHIYFICIKVALTYFTIYKDDHFLIKLPDIITVSFEMMSTDVEEFNRFAYLNGFKYTSYDCSQRKKTLTEEQIRAFIQPGDTQTDIKNKIMRWCPCRERKARMIMRQYGLTDTKYTRKSYSKSTIDSSSLS